METDFVLALAKKRDWLKPRAEKILKEHHGELETGVATLIETALVCERRGMDPEVVLPGVFALAHVEGMTVNEAMEVAHLIRHKRVTVFDAFRAVLSRGRPIVSSESAYDRLGLKRIPLEQ